MRQADASVPPVFLSLIVHTVALRRAPLVHRTAPLVHSTAPLVHSTAPLVGRTAPRVVQLRT